LYQRRDKIKTSCTTCANIYLSPKNKCKPTIDTFLKKAREKKGERFGRLIVIEAINQKYISKKKVVSQAINFRCKCDCGNKIITTIQNLRSGNTKSCGCYRRDAQRLYHRRWKNRRSRVSLREQRAFILEDNNRRILK